MKKEVLKNEVKEMTMEQVENLMAEEGLKLFPIDDENVTLKKGNKIMYKIKVVEKAKQVHIPRDRDMKLDMKKVGDINVKIIYHRMKDGTKQYRIFLAHKVDGKLQRTRLVNDNIKSIQSDEKKMLEYFNKITKSYESLKKVI